MNVVNGIDLDLLLEDQARLTKRVSELEDNQETIVRFLRGKFPMLSNQLKKLLREQEPTKKHTKLKTAFAQEDDELSTNDAIIRCKMARNVNVDPILKSVGISGTNQSSVIPERLRG